MKQFLPVALSLLIVACAPPKPGTDAHQRQLVEEARANFYALKEQERIARGGSAREDARNPSQPQQTERTAKVRLKPFAPASAPANETVYEGSKPAPVAKVNPAATPAPKLAVVPKRAPVANKPAPAPKKSSWFANSTPKPTPQPKANTKLAQKPVAKAAPTPTPKAKSSTVWTKTKQSDDTVYIYDLPKTQEPNNRRYRSYKAKYAASLGKSPENLSRKELEWVRTHYRE